jgi:ribosomal protein L32
MIRTLKTSSKRKQMMKYFWNKIKINQPLPEKKKNGSKSLSSKVSKEYMTKFQKT